MIDNNFCNTSYGKNSLLHIRKCTCTEQQQFLPSLKFRRSRREFRQISKRAVYQCLRIRTAAGASKFQRHQISERGTTTSTWQPSRHSMCRKKEKKEDKSLYALSATRQPRVEHHAYTCITYAPTCMQISEQRRHATCSSREASASICATYVDAPRTRTQAGRQDKRMCTPSE